MEFDLSVVKFVVLDFDGVFTDNRVIVGEDGRESVICSRSDGLGLTRLKKLGIPAIILSTETNAVVSRRSEKLQIECEQGIPDKAARLRDLLQERDIRPDETAYVGNDVNDLGCLQLVGCPVAVADAYPEVKAHARLVLKTRGGYGAVREFCDRLAAAYEFRSRA
ncbi:MAG: HAD hydrolase family protein [Spirochaetales bacterium]|nr:HAD hydrolase family protein [Spirochaetales bacterium]